MAVNLQGQIVNEQGTPTGGQVDVGTGNLITPPPVQPASAVPSNPTPQASTPAIPAPQPSTTINVNATPETKPTTPTGVQPLQMPSNGSVIDLLNSAGVDSSYESRQNLAKQYGIQGYTGTGAQNTDLSKKYLEAFNANKGLKVPDTGAQASSALDNYFKENTQTPQEDPQKAFFDQYMQMNPIVKTMYDTINHELSTPTTAVSFKDEFAKLQQEQGIQGLNTELMNIKNIMDGTEDDIRTEISKSGGLATDSQVAALTGARNKTLLKQANSLQQQLALKQDYVDQIMQFSQLDRAQVEKDVDRKLGLTDKLASIQEKMTSAAKDNYQTVIDIGEKRGLNGYAYLAESLGGDPKSLKLAEASLGLPNGALSNAGFLLETKKEEWSDPYKLGGSYVQKNEKTGEIRTAASIPSSGSGLSGPTSYQEWVLAGSPGTYADYLKDSNTRAPTVAQQTVSTYAARVEQANPTIAQFQDTIKNMNPVTFEAQKKLPSYFQTKEYQQFDQAARNFINATLRRESGAVISPSEFDNAYKQYLPRSGDTDATLAQKKTNRDIIYSSFKKAAGNAYESVDDLLGTTAGTRQIQYNGKTYKVDANGNMTAI